MSSLRRIRIDYEDAICWFGIDDLRFGQLLVGVLLERRRNRIPKTALELGKSRPKKEARSQSGLFFRGSRFDHQRSNSEKPPRADTMGALRVVRPPGSCKTQDARKCPDGEIGRRSGLKIRRPQGRGGSSPPLGTTDKPIKINSLQRKEPLTTRGSFVVQTALVPVLVPVCT